MNETTMAKGEIEAEIKKVETESERLRRLLYEAEQSERRAERDKVEQAKAKVERERKAPLVARAEKAMAEVVAKLTAAGLTVEMDKSAGYSNLVPGIYKVSGEHNTDVDITERLSSGSRWSGGRSTGELVAVVGGYGSAVRYPEGKKGLSVDKIVARLIDIVKNTRAERERKSEKETKRKTAAQLVTEALEARGLGTDSWDAVMKVDDYGRAIVTLHLGAEPEKAGELLDRLLAAGFIVKKETK